MKHLKPPGWGVAVDRWIFKVCLISSSVLLYSGKGNIWSLLEGCSRMMSIMLKSRDWTVSSQSARVIVSRTQATVGQASIMNPQSFHAPSCVDRPKKKDVTLTTREVIKKTSFPLAISGDCSVSSWESNGGRKWIYESDRLCSAPLLLRACFIIQSIRRNPAGPGLAASQPRYEQLHNNNRTTSIIHTTVVTGWHQHELCSNYGLVFNPPGGI